MTGSDSKVWTQNYISLFFIIAFINNFLIASIEVNNMPIVKFTLKLNIPLVIFIVSTDSLDILIIFGYFFFLIVVFGLLVFISSIATFIEEFEAKTRVKIRPSIEIFYTSSHLLNLIFFSTIKLFSFSI